MFKKVMALAVVSGSMNACGNAQINAAVASNGQLIAKTVVFSCLKGNTVLSLARSTKGNGLVVQTGPYQTDDVTDLLAKPVKAAERIDQDGAIQYRFDLGQSDGVVVNIAPHAENSNMIFNGKKFSCSTVLHLNFAELDNAVSATAK